MDCWRLVEGVEIEPPILAPDGAIAAQRTTLSAIKAFWDKRCDRASVVLITSISDEEVHTVYTVVRTIVTTVDDNLVLIWARLKKKFERKSEAEVDTAQMHSTEEALQKMIKRNMVDLLLPIVMFFQRLSHHQLPESGALSLPPPPTSSNPSLLGRLHSP